MTKATSHSPPKLTIALAQLRGAGIQRMRMHLAAELVSRGYKIEILVGSQTGELSHKIPDGITVRELSRWSKLLYFPRIVKYLLYEKPDVVLSSYEQISAMLILARKMTGSRSLILTSFHNSPRAVLREGGIIKRCLNWASYRVISSRLHKEGKIVAVSKGVGNELAVVSGIDITQITTIYNPVIPAHQSKNKKHINHLIADKNSKKKLIGYFGRLHSQKRVDVLINAFKRLCDLEEARLLIVGDGLLKDDLEALTNQFGLHDRVTFYGFSDNPTPLMKCCKVVVLPSDYEGFGNVLVEAMSCGTQVIATDCPHGPAEILDGGTYGQLVPLDDPDAMATAIRRSVNESFWVNPQKLISRADEFSVRRATDNYLDTIGLPRKWETQAPVVETLKDPR